MGLLCRWPSITEWEMFITAQGCRLRNDLYCVEWDVKLYHTIPCHTIVTLTPTRCHGRESASVIRPAEQSRSPEVGRIGTLKGPRIHVINAYTLGTLSSGWIRIRIRNRCITTRKRCHESTGTGVCLWTVCRRSTTFSCWSNRGCGQKGCLKLQPTDRR